MAEFTKKAIKASFIRLLEQMPLSKITVKSIVEDCGINRNSFYYYFEDIPSLIRETTKEELDRIVEEYKHIDSVEEGFDAALAFAMQHKRAVLHIYESTNRDIYEKYLWQICDYIVHSYFDTVFPTRRLDAADEAAIMRYYRALAFGFIIDWLESGMQDDIRDACLRLFELYRGQIEETIKRAENKNI